MKETISIYYNTMSDNIEILEPNGTIWYWWVSPNITAAGWMQTHELVDRDLGLFKYLEYIGEV